MRALPLLLLALAAGCAPRDAILLERQDSFAVGGAVLRDAQGRTFHGDHAYAFRQRPVGARPLPLVFAHGVGQTAKTWETTPDGREGFQTLFLRRGWEVILVDQPRRGRAGRSTQTVTVAPAFDEALWFNRFRLGVWPDFFPGVQFSRDPAALNQYFRQKAPTLADGQDLTLYADAYAALFDIIGPAVFVTHSQGGPVGWHTLLCTRNIRAIIAYEPGGWFPFPPGHCPPEGAVLTLSGKPEGEEVAWETFRRFTEIPIVIYYGDNLPPTEDCPEQYEWTRRLALARQWATLINAHGGDCTVVHLPEAGLRGNTHFPFSDLNNVAVADLLSAWLHEKGLD